MFSRQMTNCCFANLLYFPNRKRIKIIPFLTSLDVSDYILKLNGWLERPYESDRTAALKLCGQSSRRWLCQNLVPCTRAALLFKPLLSKAASEMHVIKHGSISSTYLCPNAVVG